MSVDELGNVYERTQLVLHKASHRRRASRVESLLRRDKAGIGGALADNGADSEPEAKHRSARHSDEARGIDGRPVELEFWRRTEIPGPDPHLRLDQRPRMRVFAVVAAIVHDDDPSIGEGQQVLQRRVILRLAEVEHRAVQRGLGSRPSVLELILRLN